MSTRFGRQGLDGRPRRADDSKLPSLRSLVDGISMDNLLTNLATLKVYWDQSDTDLLSNFMPLVGYAIKTLPNRIVSEEELVERIYQVAEFKIPRAAANILIRRASRTRYKFINKE